MTEIISNNPIAEGVYSVTLLCEDITKQARAGQFLHIKCGDSRLLRRPLSICTVIDDTVKIVFEIKGEGTKWLSARRPGDTLNVLGPLGKGFTFPGGDIIIIGGGIGVPPMLFAAHSAAGRVTAILGFKDKSKIILYDDFKRVCSDVIVTTDDGSAGRGGMVTSPLEELLAGGGFEAVLSCGPYVMQKAVAALCRQYNIPCRVSLEERMGCGVGACLVCACATQNGYDKQMSRVCADGPVFDAKEVVW